MYVIGMGISTMQKKTSFIEVYRACSKIKKCANTHLV